jgi:tRNA 2-thiouridine synthesizing protein A
MSFATDISPESNSPVMHKFSCGPVAAAELIADRTLDITGQVCPMTFVRTRLALDCMQRGQTLLVLLRGDEPRKNVPATATAQGHTVLAQHDGADGVTRLWLRKG